MRELLQEKVYKTHIIDLELLTSPQTKWRHDPAWPILLFQLQFIQINDVYFVLLHNEHFKFHKIKVVSILELISLTSQW